MSAKPSHDAVGDRFAWLDRVGHDLRGPLSPLRTAVQLLQSGRVPPERMGEMLQLIDRQIDQLVGVIDEVSDMAKLSRGQLACTLAVHDFRSLLDLVAGRVGRGIADAGLHLVMRLPDEPVEIEADARRFAQLVAGLVRRLAESRVSAASIEIELTANEESALLRMSSSDPATPDPELDYLVTGQPSSDLGGVPMRLAIARHIAHLHGVAIETGGSVEREVRLRVPLVRTSEAGVGPDLARRSN